MDETPPDSGDGCDSARAGQRKPTVNDIARVAGVSLATVDRVINGRKGVRSGTIKRVNQAIEELGFVRDTAAANLARQRVYRLLFIMPATTNEFVLSLRRVIEANRSRLLFERTELDIFNVPPFDPQAIAKALDELDPANHDGVAVFGPETPSVRDAINQVRARGIAVVTLVSDLPSSDRDHFVGIDNIAAGRTAGRLMGNFIGASGRQRLSNPGPILVITGSRLARDHIERRSGFDSVISGHFDHLHVLASVEGKDDPDLIYERLPQVFADHPDLAGIYSSAAGNDGLIRFLKEFDPERKLSIVAHELTETSRKALGDGLFDAIISQDPGHLIRSAKRLMRATADGSPIDLTMERIRIDIYVKENLPPPQASGGEIVE